MSNPDDYFGDPVEESDYYSSEGDGSSSEDYDDDDSGDDDDEDHPGENVRPRDPQRMETSNIENYDELDEDTSNGFWSEVSELNDGELLSGDDVDFDDDEEEIPVEETDENDDDESLDPRDVMEESKTIQFEESWVSDEGSSHYDSEFEYMEGGESSKVPLDFDAGSYDGEILHSSDEEEEKPEDYEQECRAMIAVVHPNLDPETMIHGCDLRNLYKNMKHQYRHLLKKGQESKTFEREDDSEFLEEEFDQSDDDDDSHEEYVEEAYESSDISNSVDDDPISRQPIRDEIAHKDAMKLPAIEQSSGEHEGDGGTEREEEDSTSTIKVEKWLERDADDPDDYEYACRRLSLAMYGIDNPDHDIDTMLSRSSHIDLYRYLKQQYWYLVHTGQLGKDKLNQDDTNETTTNGLVENGERMEKLTEKSGNRGRSDSARSLEEVLKSKNQEMDHSQNNRVKNIASMFAAKAENSEREKPRNNDWKTSTEIETLKSPEIEEDENFDSDDGSSQIGETKEEVRSDFKRAEEETRSFESRNDEEDEIDDSYHINAPQSHHPYHDSSVSGITILSSKWDDDDVVPTSDEDTDDGPVQRDKFDSYKREYKEMLARENNGDHIDEDRLYLLELVMRKEVGENLTEDEAEDLEEFYDHEGRGGGLNIVNESDEEVTTSDEEESGSDDEDVTSHQSEESESVDHSIQNEHEESTSIRLGQDSMMNEVTGDYDGGNSLSFNRIVIPNIKRDKDTHEINNSISLINSQKGDDSLSMNEFNVTGGGKEGSGTASSRDHSITESFESLGFGSVVDLHRESEYENQDETEKDRLVDQDSSLQSSLFHAESNFSSFSFDQLPDAFGISQSAGERPKTPVKDPKELEWRKGKIEGDFKSIVEEAEDAELKDSIPGDMVLALYAASLKIALVKKYYDAIKKDNIYFPSVAKALYDFSLIEEAEKEFGSELPFVFSTALCTVAASRLNGDVDEVDEEDIIVRKATVNVVLDDERCPDSDENNRSSGKVEDKLTSSKVDKDETSRIDEDPVADCDADCDSLDKNEILSRSLPSLTEPITRENRIRYDLLAVIKDAEKNDLDGELDKEVFKSLVKAAERVAYVKKFHDDTIDKFIYFPSVTETFLDYSIFEKVEDFYLGGGHEFPVEYTSALRAAAARMSESLDLEKFGCDAAEIDTIVPETVVDCVVGGADNIGSDKCEESSMKDLPKLSSSDKRNTVLLEDSSDADVEGKHNDGKQISGKDAHQRTDSKHEDSVEKIESYPERDSTHPSDSDKNTLELDGSSVGSNDEETRLKEMSEIMAFRRRVEKQKIAHEANTLNEKKKKEVCKASEDAKSMHEKHRIAMAELDEEASLLQEKYLEDKRTLDSALVDVASDLASELELIDQNIKKCSVNHEREAERVEEERNEIEEKFLAGEKVMEKRTKILLEKLTSAVSALTLEQNNGGVGVEMAENGIVDGNKRGWFGGIGKRKDPEEEKQRQKKLLESELRQIELKRDVENIKAELNAIKEEAKAKMQKMNDSQKKLDDYYRSLDDFASANEDKLRNQKVQVKASFEKERQRLMKKKRDIDATRIDDEKWLASAKQKLLQDYERQQRELECANLDREEMEKEEEEKLNRNAIALEEKWIREDAALLREREAFERKANEGDDTDPSFDTEDKYNEESGIFENSIQEGQITDEKKCDELCVVPDHLARLHQPKITQDDDSLGSLDIFDTPKANQLSGKKLLAAALKGKQEKHESVQERNESSLPEREEEQPSPAHLAELNQPKELHDEEESLGPDDVFDLPKAKNVPGKKPLAATLKEKQQDGKEMVKSEPVPKTPTNHMIDKGVQRIDRFESSSPSKSLIEKRRKVEEARERAMAIRNGDSRIAQQNDRLRTKTEIPREGHRVTPVMSSRHLWQDVPQGSQIVHPVTKNEPLHNKPSFQRENIVRVPSKDSPTDHSAFSDSSSMERFKNQHVSSSSREPMHPMYPMIRETDRLAGFIRRYEKKLEKVCKSLLTLASVSGEEKEVLVARDLELPEMLSFVTEQDWYKAHSDKKPEELPRLMFRKPKPTNLFDTDRSQKYVITATGIRFLQIEGPVQSDVFKFLTHLKCTSTGLTRDTMIEKWNQIALQCGDEQSQRVYDKIHNLISFCLDSRMIQERGKHQP